MRNRKTITVDRKQLYEEIWSNSLHRTAIKYNAAEAKLKQSCIDADIPLPTLSFWGRKGVGYDVSSEITPLPESDIKSVEIVLKGEKAQSEKTVKKHPAKQTKKKSEKASITTMEKEPSVKEGIVVLSRQEFYEEIWQQRNMAEISRKYDIPSTRLITLCKASVIPIPKYGYGWYYSSKKDPLPESRQTEVMLYTRKARYKGALGEWQEYIRYLSDLNNVQEEPTKKSLRQIMKGGTNVSNGETTDNDAILADLMQSDYLRLMDNRVREEIFTQAITINTVKKGRLHNDVIRYRNTIDAWEKQGSRNYYDRIDPPSNVKNFSKASRKRVFAILDVLYRAIEPFGGTVTKDFDIAIGKDVIGIEIVEGKDDIPHVMTKDEARKLVEYNDAKRHGRYAWEPQIPKYDHPYNGRLRIRVGNSWRDSTRASYGDSKDGELIEDQLGEILITIFVKSEHERIEREKREEEQRRREEERRIAEERRQRIELEKEKTNELIKCAEDYHIAQNIRIFVKAKIGEGVISDELRAWTEWALKKADWIDPIIQREDEYLGKRRGDS